MTGYQVLNILGLEPEELLEGPRGVRIAEGFYIFLSDSTNFRTVDFCFCKASLLVL